MEREERGRSGNSEKHTFSVFDEAYCGMIKEDGCYEDNIYQCCLSKTLSGSNLMVFL